MCALLQANSKQMCLRWAQAFNSYWFIWLLIRLIYALIWFARKLIVCLSWPSKSEQNKNNKYDQFPTSSPLERMHNTHVCAVPCDDVTLNRPSERADRNVNEREHKIWLRDRDHSHTQRKMIQHQISLLLSNHRQLRVYSALRMLRSLVHSLIPMHHIRLDYFIKTFLMSRICFVWCEAQASVAVCALLLSPVTQQIISQ